MNHKRGRPRRIPSERHFFKWVGNGSARVCIVNTAERHSDHARRKAAAEAVKQFVNTESERHWAHVDMFYDTSPEWCGCSECWRMANPEVYPLLLAFDPRFPPPEGLTP
jgi:hypothetical protein